MFVSASFGTFVCALVLTVRTVVADAKPPSLSPSVTHHDVPVKKKIKTLKVEPILTDLLAGRRSVLLLSSLPTRFLVIVSAPGQKDLPSSVVFDQPPETFNGTSVTLTPPVLFTDKWPKVTGATLGFLFTVTDSTGSYLVIANKATIQLLNLKTEDLTDGKLGSVLCGNYFDQTPPLSSSKTSTFFSLSHGATNNIRVTEGTFIGSMVSSTEITNKDRSYSFCQTDQEQILLSKGACKTSGISWTRWNISTGFVDSSSAYLVNSATPSIIKFDQAVLQPQYPTVSFTSIAFSSFWRKGVIPTTTPPPPPTTHHIKTSHLLLYCSIGGSLLLLLIVIAFCFCFCASKPKQPSMATPSPEKAAASSSAPKLSPLADANSPYLIPSVMKKCEVLAKMTPNRVRSSSRKLNAPARKRSSGKVAPPSGKTSSASVISKVSLAKKRSTGKGVSGKRASGKTSPKGRK